MTLPMTLLVTFFIVIALVPALVRVASPRSLVAVPGEHRGHSAPTPLVGGIAVMVAFAAGVLIGVDDIPAGLGVAMLLLAVFGTLDDRFTLPFWVRFLVQIAAAVVLVEDGSRLVTLGALFSEDVVYLGTWEYGLTVFAIVGVINAVNMIDGMDGLMAGVVIVALSAVVIAAYPASTRETQAALVMIAALLGFFMFNARLPGRGQVTTFMGDGGSMPVGVFMAWILVNGSQPPESIIAPVAAIWFLMLPLFDTVGVMLRRLLRGRSPFAADRKHTHHYLQARTGSVTWTVLTLICIAVAGACAGLLAMKPGVPESIMFYGFLVLFGVYLVVMERYGRTAR